MATVNYSVPDEVKEAFDATFAGRNKSAIIARLMIQPVEEEQKVHRRSKAIDRLLSRRHRRPAVTEKEIRAARQAAPR